MRNTLLTAAAFACVLATSLCARPELALASEARVIGGTVQSMYGNALRMRSDAGNNLTIDYSGATLVVDINNRELGTGALRAGGRIVVAGFVPAAGFVNARSIRVLGGSPTSGERAIVGTLVLARGFTVQMRSEAGNVIAVGFFGRTPVVGVNDDQLSPESLRAGQAVTVTGYAPSAGIINADMIRIRSGAITPQPPVLPSNRVIMGGVLAVYPNSLSLRSDAGNTISVNRGNTAVIDVNGRELAWSMIRAGQAITVSGFVPSPGVINAENIRIRTPNLAPVPPANPSNRTIAGRVTAIYPGYMMMRSDVGNNVQVVYANAMIVINSVGRVVDRSVLRVGQSVSVTGNVQSTGVITANQISLQS
jgi:cytochrome c-type biogenesis protein CcmE